MQVMHIHDKANGSINMIATFHWETINNQNGNILNAMICRIQWCEFCQNP